MSKAQGMTINYSMITNEQGQKEVGFRYNDSDGIDIDKHYVGERNDDILTKLCQDVVNEMQKQTAAINREKKKKMLNEQKKANRKTKNYDEIIAQLQQELKEAKEENQSLKLDNEVLSKRITDNLNKKPEQQPKESKNEDFVISLFDNKGFDDIIDKIISMM